MGTDTRAAVGRALARSRPLGLLALGWGLSGALKAQETVGYQGANRLSVYVANFTTRDSATYRNSLMQVGDLSASIPDLINLRLLQVQVISSSRVPQPPDCERLNPAAQRASQDVRFYLVRGTVEARGDGAVVHYLVTKCDAGAETPALSDSRSLTRWNAYQQIEDIGDAIARGLRAYAPLTAVAIDTFRVVGLDREAGRLAVRGPNAIADALWHSGTYAVRYDARYRVRGVLRAQKGRSITASIAIVQGAGDTVAGGTVVGTRDSLDAFFETVADHTMIWLNTIRTGQAPGPATPLAGDSILARARLLLCLSAKPGCIADPAAAADLAASSTALARRSWEALMLSGIAATRQGRYSIAVDALERARREIAGDPSAGTEDAALLMNTLGRAYQALQNYTAAGRAFDSSLAIKPGQVTTLIAKAENEKLQDDRPSALNTLTTALSVPRPARDTVVLALRTIHFECNEYVFDFPCSFQIDSILDARGLVVAAEDSVRMIEAAVLDGQELKARELLGPLSQSQLDPCLGPVFQFYQLWLGLIQRTPSDAQTYYASWMNQAAKSRQGTGKCWVFYGAKHRLNNQNSAPIHNELLVAVLQAIESGKDFPAWAD